MEVNRVTKSNDNIKVHLKIFSKDYAILFRRSGHGLDGIIIEEAKDFLANFLKTQIQLDSIQC